MNGFSMQCIYVHNGICWLFPHICCKIYYKMVNCFQCRWEHYWYYRWTKQSIDEPKTVNKEYGRGAGCVYIFEWCDFNSVAIRGLRFVVMGSGQCLVDYRYSLKEQRSLLLKLVMQNIFKTKHKPCQLVASAQMPTGAQLVNWSYSCIRITSHTLYYVFTM